MVSPIGERVPHGENRGGKTGEILFPWCTDRGSPAMTFNEYWRALIARNPDLEKSVSLAISTDSFKRSLRQAFEIGEKQGQGEAGGGLLGGIDSIFGRKP